MADIPFVSESADVDDSDFRAAADGDRFINDGRTVLMIKNTSGVARTVTLMAQTVCSHKFLHDQVLTVNPSTILQTQEIPVYRFNSGRYAYVSYDDVTGLEVVTVRREVYGQ